MREGTEAEETEKSSVRFSVRRKSQAIDRYPNRSAYLWTHCSLNTRVRRARTADSARSASVLHVASVVCEGLACDESKGPSCLYSEHSHIRSVIMILVETVGLFLAPLSLLNSARVQDTVYTAAVVTK